MHGPLGNGSRVAILGGGPAGACAAAALLSSARRLGRIVEVCLYHEDGAPDELAEPLAVDQPTAVRLASLGVGIPQGFLARYFGLAFHGAGASSPLVQVQRPVALVAPGSPAAAFRRLLRGVAAGLGARSVPCRASLLPESSVPPGGRALEVRSRGLVQASECAILAGGVRGGSSAAGEGARGLRGGSCLWLGATRPFPRRFGSWIHLFALPGGSWLWVVPTGQRLFVAGGGEVAQLLDRVMSLQRDGLLPIEIKVERAWSRPWRPAGRLRSEDDRGIFRIGENAGALWPLQAFPAAVRQALRLAEDLLALPPGEDGPERHRVRVRQAEWSAKSRWRLLERAGNLDLGRPASIRAVGWLLEDDTRSPPELPLLGRGFWRRWRRRLRRLRFAPRSGSADTPVPPGLDASLVYVVDDDPASRTLLTQWLAERGVRVRSFADELALPARAARERPGVILLDVVLRRLDGITLLDRLELDPATRRIPVLLMSGADPELGAARPHPHAFLHKPLDLTQLWELLRPLVALPPLGLKVGFDRPA
ncbi:MAG: response regulator [Myxococcales bacterium]